MDLRKLDAKVAGLMGLNVVAMDWPCEHSPDCGYYEAIDVFQEGESPDDAGYEHRGPIYLEPDHEWPPQRNEDGDIVVMGAAPVPFYSTDMAAAWLVVEKVRGMGHSVLIGNVDTSKWGCNLWHKTKKDIPGVAVTAPLAICLAALKAYGVDTSEFEAA